MSARTEGHFLGHHHFHHHFSLVAPFYNRLSKSFLRIIFLSSCHILITLTIIKTGKEWRWLPWSGWKAPRDTFGQRIAPLVAVVTTKLSYYCVIKTNKKWKSALNTEFFNLVFNFQIIHCSALRLHRRAIINVSIILFWVRVSDTYWWFNQTLNRAQRLFNSIFNSISD